MADPYPTSTAVGYQVNRQTPVKREWPFEESTFKDGSKTVRYLSASPRRSWRLEYDGILKSHYNALVAHYDSVHGMAGSFSFTPRGTSTAATVRYLEFNVDVRKSGLDPNVHPDLVVVLEEVI